MTSWRIIFLQEVEMDNIFQVDWQSIFVPHTSLLEIIIRGTFMYLAIFVLLRIFRRQAGAFSISDLIVIVIIADAAQNGMAGDSKSVTESLILIGTIIFWDYLLDWLGFKSQFFRRMLKPEKLPVIENGKFLRENMRRELITPDELLSQMRECGIEDISDIKTANLESDGHFSFIKKHMDEAGKNPKKGKGVR
jgi:uncharacterized membrane protein YcaP (DUF421 family)